jgi:drug/metabolite transporter (DMT)-like permease
MTTPDSTRASLILVFACACWAFSFPIMKALEQVGRLQLPGATSVFFASLCVAIRFSVAGVVMALVCGRSLARTTRLEWLQGGGLGLFGGFGLVLQMDGMAYTLASTSAFITQAYCVLIPVWLCVRHLRWPAPQVAGACALALAGAALLAGLGTEKFQFGRGEWETLAGSVMFTCQILWLDRPLFHGNNSLRASTLMFLVMALTTWPMAVLTGPTPTAVLHAYSSSSAIGLLAVLIVLCTLITFPLANHWQPKISATQAGLLYCTEPVFTALVTLFVPGFISRTTGIQYPDESMTLHLVLGGATILAANAWILARPPANPSRA